MDPTSYPRSFISVLYPEQLCETRCLYTIVSVRALLARVLWFLSCMSCINWDSLMNRRLLYTCVYCHLLPPQSLDPWPSEELPALLYLIFEFE